MSLALSSGMIKAYLNRFVIVKPKPVPPPTHPKVEQILDGARAAFIELGFEGTSVDEIARRARVSKPTLYAHLGDKRAIFTAVLRREFEAHARHIFPETPNATSVEDALRDIAEHHIAFLTSDDAQDLFRLAVAESQRFPEIGRAFYDAGPGLGVSRLATYLAASAAKGDLVIDDPDVAAHQFIELCRADLFYKRLLLGVRPFAEDVRRMAREVSRLFIKAYGADREVR